MIKAIIFDFFGVVGQSTYQLVIEDMQITPEQSTALTDLHKTFDNGYIDDNQFLHNYADILGLDYQDFIKKYYESEDRFSNSYRMLALVEDLKKNHKVGLLSNVGIDGYTKFIEPIKHHFDVVVTSFESGLAKPDISIFEHTAARLSCDTSECVMIDDSAINCKGAQAAGMNAIVFKDLISTKEQLVRMLNP